MDVKLDYWWCPDCKAKVRPVFHALKKRCPVCLGIATHVVQCPACAQTHDSTVCLNELPLYPSVGCPR